MLLEKEKELLEKEQTVMVLREEVSREVEPTTAGVCSRGPGRSTQPSRQLCLVEARRGRSWHAPAGQFSACTRA